MLCGTRKSPIYGSHGTILAPCAQKLRFLLLSSRFYRHFRVPDGYFVSVDPCILPDISLFLTRQQKNKYSFPDKALKTGLLTTQQKTNTAFLTRQKTVHDMRHRPFLLHFLVLIHLRKLRRLVRRDTCIDDLLDVSVHDLIQLVQGKIDSVIRHTSLWEVVGTDLLGTVTGTDLAAAHLSLCIMALLLLNIVELCL